MIDSDYMGNGIVRLRALGVVCDAVQLEGVYGVAVPDAAGAGAVVDASRKLLIQGGGCEIPAFVIFGESGESDSVSPVRDEGMSSSPELDGLVRFVQLLWSCAAGGGMVAADCGRDEGRIDSMALMEVVDGLESLVGELEMEELMELFGCGSPRDMATFVRRIIDSRGNHRGVSGWEA